MGLSASQLKSCTQPNRGVHVGRVDVGGEVTAKNIMIATGSVPFVPPGIPIDGKTVGTQRFPHASKPLCGPAGA